MVEKFNLSRREFFKELSRLGAGALVLFILPKNLVDFFRRVFKNKNENFDPLEEVEKLIEKINYEIQRINHKNNSDTGEALMPYIHNKIFDLSDLSLNGKSFNRKVTFLIERDLLIMQTDNFTQSERISFFITFFIKADERGDFNNLLKIKKGNDEEYSALENVRNLNIKGALEASPEDFYLIKNNLEDILNLLQTIE